MCSKCSDLFAVWGWKNGWMVIKRGWAYMHSVWPYLLFREWRPLQEGPLTPLVLPLLAAQELVVERLVSLSAIAQLLAIVLSNAMLEKLWPVSACINQSLGCSCCTFRPFTAYCSVWITQFKSKDIHQAWTGSVLKHFAQCHQVLMILASNKPLHDIYFIIMNIISQERMIKEIWQKWLY